ncbi:DNA (cytosine-5-)-methyltransferase [Lysinibacillus fusiformis]|uniref:DNA (cytosine-5-)-methyltransferase n=1 Tax=Lysinibacillus fusiformis TaxID=28031 RepID=UPI003D088903
MDQNQPTVVSLFCGAGGMDYGFKRAGFKIILGIDIDKDSCNTYKKNLDANVYNTDIFQLDPNELPDSDVIISSIVTPSFSSVRSEQNNGSVKYLDTILKIISFKQPKSIVLECVKSSRSYKSNSQFDEILMSLENLGYNVSYQILNTINYSIPQKKSRLVIVGVKRDFTNVRYEFPTPQTNTTTLSEILSDIDLSNNYTVAPILNNRRSKILNLNGVSNAIVSNMHYYLDFNTYLKKLTSREIGLIQSFPKEYVFEGNESSRLRQICLAFPPTLAYHVAKELLSLFDCMDDIERNDLNAQEINQGGNFEIEEKLLKQSVPVLNLSEIQSGKEGAYIFEDSVFEALKYIFSHQLILGEKQYHINEGRKRVDIKFNNKIGEGFFGSLKPLFDIKSAVIFIECKNYTGDLKNPDFDQLSGRFNRHSSFGILICRRIDNKDKIVQICKDISNNGRGYVLVLDADDISYLIDLRKKEDYTAIDNHMTKLLNGLLF